MKSLSTLIPDIESLFKNGTAVNEDNLKAFSKNLEDLLRKRLSLRTVEDKPTLRMSKLGTPNRKLWYEFNEPVAQNQGSALKFIYGDIIEQLVIFLVKEAGHLVEDEQKEVVIDGIVGHQDCKIDGVTVDIKSASSFAFRKFAKAELFQDDPFGYIAQLSSYMYAAGNDKGAFLAVNKENGDLSLLNLQAIDTINPPARIAEMKGVIKQSSPPTAKCYPAEPEGKSGNMALANSCTYCPFKEKCWEDANNGLGLRKFQYSSGVKYLTEVLNTPRVPEITNSPPSMEDVITTTKGETTNDSVH